MATESCTSPHEIIEDYNATYNVMRRNKFITTSAAKGLKVPIGEIWVSELWKTHEKFIVFNELREISWRAKGLGRNEAHEKARKDEASLWEDDRLWRRMNEHVADMDLKTMKKRCW